VIVKKGYKDEYWQAKAQIQLAGYDTKTFGKNETQFFSIGLKKTLDMPTNDFVVVDKLVVCNTGQRKALGQLPGGTKKCINVIFTLNCAQESYLDKLVTMLEEPQFVSAFKTELLHNEHLSVSAFAVNGQTAVAAVVASAAKTVLGMVGLFFILIYSIGTYKLSLIQMDMAIASNKARAAGHFSSEAAERKPLHITDKAVDGPACDAKI
jgi:hypothetical protein